MSNDAVSSAQSKHMVGGEMARLGLGRDELLFWLWLQLVMLALVAVMWQWTGVAQGMN
jgi:hypothetical protein